MIDYFASLAASQQGGQVTIEQATTSYHCRVAMGQKAQADELRSTWGKQHLQTKVDTVEPELWKLIAEPSLDLAILQPYTFILHFTFTLAQPYLSKDDNPFYIIDNPIVRDKVFRLPMVRPSSWKGSLRHALWQQGHQKEDQQIQRLFGEANDNDDSGKAGRLYFYPTFFDKTSLEIINPHNRTTGVGKNPILLESVPAGATGTFTLLYVPFDRIGSEKVDPERNQKSLSDEVAEDLVLVATGIKDMLTLYSFGAKTSSGFGLADEHVKEGVLTLNYADTTQVERPARPVPPVAPELPVALRAYLAEFPNENFVLKLKEWNKRHNPTNKRYEAYKIARTAHQEYQRVLANHQVAREHYQNELAKWESVANVPVLDQTKRVFSNFDGFVQQAQTVVERIRQEKEVTHEPNNFD